MGIARVNNAGTPNPPPARAEAAAGGEGDFAQLMAMQAPADAAPADAAQARSDDARQTRARQAAKTAPREEKKARAEATEAAQPASGEHAGTEAAEETSDPNLAQWLAQWHRPAPAEEAAPAETGGAAKKKALPEAAGIEATDKPAARPDKLLRGNDKSAREQGRPAIEAETPAPARDEAAAATANITPRETPSTGAFTLPAGFEPVASSAAPAAPAPAAADASVLGVPVPVPLDSPEFAAAFGVEISLLAKDGVQQAELHLNPAEMGPVSVQIALDGEKARIDFGAQAAATRAAIEASLPELAAALRDAGLTLAGGGVNQYNGQHTGQRSGQRDEPRRDAPGERRIEGSASASAASARPAWRGRVSASGVDLYA